MDDIPGFVWVIVGIFISVVSLFMGFIKPVTGSSFFKLTLIVGIGMLAYGYIFKIRARKTKEEMFEDRKQQLMQQRGENEVDIDIDDYKSNPYLREEARKRGYPSTQPNQQFRQAEMEFQQKIKSPQQNSQQQQQRQQSPSYQPQQSQQRMQQTQSNSRFCPSCGTPLLKQHKFCPICGARV
jgi:FtsZ-interacting cell division protein ZipA